MSRRLLELARLNETTVVIEGETIRMREPNGLEMMEYRRLRAGSKGDPTATPPVPETPPNLTGAIAHLIHHCVIDEHGAQVYNVLEAQQIAGGRSQIFLPMLLAVMGFESSTTEKKS